MEVGVASVSDHFQRKMKDVEMPLNTVPGQILRFDAPPQHRSTNGRVRTVLAGSIVPAWTAAPQTMGIALTLNSVMEEGIRNICMTQCLA